MPEIKTTDLIIDDEFYRLEPTVKNNYEIDIRLSAGEAAHSAEVYVWGKLILEGFSRYELCIKYGIPFKTVQVHCSDRWEAISWTCVENLKKSRLTNEMRIYLIGKRYLAEKCGLAASRPRPVNTHNNVTGENNVALSKHRAGTLIGNNYGIAFSTVLKYSMYSQAVDKIASAAPGLADMILSGDLLLSQNTVIGLSRLTESELAAVNADPINFFSSAQLKKRGRGRPPIYEKNIVADSHTTANIKQMPTYDPDSTIAGLTLTIPSWISSIVRVKNTADFSAISKNALNGLALQLNKLIDNSYELINIMQEASK